MIPIIYSDRAKEEIERLLDRASAANEKELAAVKAILADVKARGDEAVLEYTRRFDCPDMTLEKIRVTEEEIAAAYEKISPGLLSVMRRSAENIRAFHQQQK